ncbi:hypothetical protein KFK09_023002 [Dendrobium nobile]|uniref:Uncharacterized protein n=1 Tax=Dendrobium nobile TaxID=94219 RepID=A0A8T3AKX8_DENNO|nr:hypothetical protein KFK09_023002 [Dendrobium nobile]
MRTHDLASEVKEEHADVTFQLRVPLFASTSAPAFRGPHPLSTFTIPPMLEPLDESTSRAGTQLNSSSIIQRACKSAQALARLSRLISTG